MVLIVFVILIILILFLFLCIEHFNINDYTNIFNNECTFKQTKSNDILINNISIDTLLFPIGSIYVSKNKEDDPNRFIGTSWELIQKPNTYQYIMNSRSPGTSGGTSEEHKITADNIPLHTHTYHRGKPLKQCGQSYNDFTVGWNSEKNNKEMSELYDGNGNQITYQVSFYPKFMKFYFWKRIK